MKTSKMILGCFWSYLVLSLSQGFGGGIAILLMKFTPIPNSVCYVLWCTLYILFAYLGSKLLANNYLKDDIEDYVGKFKLDFKWLIVGILLPLLVIGTYFLLSGKLINTNMSTKDIINTLSFGLFVQSIAAGIVEEMVFRGMMMNILRKKYSDMVAVLVPGVIFALIHIANYSVTGIQNILILLISGTLVSVMFALISLKSKSIWNNALVHGLWNLVIISGVIYIGTTQNNDYLYNYILNTKSLLITGGQFGIEASIIANIGYAVVSLFTLYLIKREKGENK